MTDSRYQLHDRIDSLQGELKAAEEQDRLNEDDYAVKEHALNLSSQARQKGKDNIARIKQALREAGQAYSEAVLALTGDGPVAVEWGADVGREAIEPYCANHGRAIYHRTADGLTICEECQEPYIPSSFPNAIFNGLDTEQAQ